MKAHRKLDLFFFASFSLFVAILVVAIDAGNGGIAALLFTVLGPIFAGCYIQMDILLSDMGHRR